MLVQPNPPEPRGPVYYGLQLLYVLLAIQAFKAISVLVWTAVMGFTWEQSKEAFALLPGTMEALGFTLVLGAWVAWVFGRPG